MNILIVDDEEAVLRYLSRMFEKVIPGAAITVSDSAEKALELCRKVHFDVAFLDINMPVMDGLTLAKKMLRSRPIMNIIMVTAYPQFALDAMKLYVCDYIIKPPLPEDIQKALSHLRYPIVETRRGLYVQCFGNFEVFYDGEPIHFGRAKTKEFFAYLTDRRGTAATNAEIRAVLWNNDPDEAEKQRKYIAQISYELRALLEQYSLSDIFVQSRDSYAIAPEKMQCDYYIALSKNAEILTSYGGDYMSQYEWAKYRV
ncbi:MAG: response regulator [Ruminiclostridium sp.]|nr:response regulator [Ruminiclostridium sp.]